VLRRVGKLLVSDQGLILEQYRGYYRRVRTTGWGEKPLARVRHGRHRVWVSIAELVGAPILDKPDGPLEIRPAPVPGYFASDWGDIYSSRRDGLRPLRPFTRDHGRGYRHLILAGRNYYVHRIVLESFIGPAPTGCECAHLDSDRTNCNIRNLRWVPHVVNMAMAATTGRMCRGRAHHHSRLTEAQVWRIRERRRLQLD
jgi:hypothetical protein